MNYTHEQYTKLRKALMGTSQEYEVVRTDLIVVLGYVNFQQLQSDVFKEIGSIDGQGNCQCASCCVIRTAIRHGTLPGHGKD